MGAATGTARVSAGTATVTARPKRASFQPIRAFSTRMTLADRANPSRAGAGEASPGAGAVCPTGLSGVNDQLGCPARSISSRISGLTKARRSIATRRWSRGESASVTSSRPIRIISGREKPGGLDSVTSSSVSVGIQASLIPTGPAIVSVRPVACFTAAARRGFRPSGSSNPVTSQTTRPSVTPITPRLIHSARRAPVCSVPVCLVMIQPASRRGGRAAGAVKPRMAKVSIMWGGSSASTRSTPPAGCGRVRARACRCSLSGRPLTVAEKAWF